jgi:radical SAM protein with 4Fe4S-binding SPASM domain
VCARKLVEVAFGNGMVVQHRHVFTLSKKGGCPLLTVDGTRLVRSPNTTTRRIDGANVILRYDGSQLVVLNEVASRIWDLCEREDTPNAMAHRISAEYAVDASTALEDVDSFLSDSHHNGLFIRAADASFPRRFRQLTGAAYDQLNEFGCDHTLPTTTKIKLTDSCNLHCVHCKVLPVPEELLTTAELCGVIEQLESMGCFEISFSGGELFTRNDSVDVIEYADSRQFAISLFTSLTSLTDDQALRLARLHISNIQVSIYSADPRVHDGITGVSGSLQKSIANIERLLASDMRITLACVVMKPNFETHELVTRLANDLGVACTLAYPVTAKEDGSKSTFVLRLSDAQLYQLFEANSHKFCKKRERDIDAPICSGGRSMCSINASGDVFPCGTLPLKVGSIRKNTLREIWNESGDLISFRRLTLRDRQDCSGCRLVDYCRVCPGLSLLEEGDLLKPAEVNCQMARTVSEILAATN